jgi:tripartite-type tricarboxylate transporter receptor subunit TctC
MNRRSILQAAACLSAAGALGFPGIAVAKSYATRTAKIIVAGPPGGSSDSMARMIAAELGPLLGQSVIVDNRPGAGGVIGTRAVVDAAPDGHTLLLGHVATNAIVPALYSPKPFDAVADFEPISPVGSAPDLLVVSARSPARSLQELLELGRKGEELTYGSPGIGLPQHFFGFMLAKESGVRMRHVPYRGSAPALMDVLGGQISMMFVTSGAAAPHVRSGQVRPLAAATDARSPFFPQVPSMRELGFPSAAQRTWFGIFAPARTPRTIADELNAAIGTIIARPDVRAKFEGIYIEPDAPQAREAYRAYVQAEAGKWADIVKKSGITPE